jgi:hypothetical protein
MTMKEHRTNQQSYESHGKTVSNNVTSSKCCGFINSYLREQLTSDQCNESYRSKTHIQCRTLENRTYETIEFEYQDLLLEI